MLEDPNTGICRKNTALRAATILFFLTGTWVFSAGKGSSSSGFPEATAGGTTGASSTTTSSSGGSTTAVGDWNVTYLPVSPTKPVKTDYTGEGYSAHTWYVAYGSQGASGDGWGTGQPLTSDPSLGALDGEGHGTISNQSTSITATLEWDGAGDPPDALLVYESSWTYWYGNSGSDSNGINGSGFASRVSEHEVDVNGRIQVSVTPSVTATSSTTPAGIAVAYLVRPYDVRIDLAGVLDESTNPRLLAGQLLDASLVSSIPADDNDEYYWTYSTETLPYATYAADADEAVLTLLANLDTQTISLYNARPELLTLTCEFYSGYLDDTLTVSVDVEVEGPEFEVLAAAGEVHLNADLTLENASLMMFDSNSYPGSPGIIFGAWVATPSEYGYGSWQYVQTVSPSRYVQEQDLDWFEWGLNDIVCLDTYFPYGYKYPDSGSASEGCFWTNWILSDSQQTAYYTEDTPIQPYSGLRIAQVELPYYRMHIFYRPPGVGATAVVPSMWTWSWSGKASDVNGTYQLSNESDPIPVESIWPPQPTWSQNCTDGEWVPSGGP